MANARQQLREKLRADPAAREKFYAAFKEMVKAVGLDANDPKVMKELGFGITDPKDTGFAAETDGTVVVTIVN
jgi:hypothetical protein